MPDNEKELIRQTAAIYMQMPDYIRGKIDGYAEAIKEARQAQQKNAG